MWNYEKKVTKMSTSSDLVIPLLGIYLKEANDKKKGPMHHKIIVTAFVVSVTQEFSDILLGGVLSILPSGLSKHWDYLRRNQVKDSEQKQR